MSESNTTKTVYYIIAISLPLFLILLAEIFLRGISFGDDIPVFVESKTYSGFMETNPDLVHRYYADPILAPDVSPDTVYFSKQKTKNTFRIVIQGGSTAAGFPYGRFGSLQGMMQQRFKRLYPNKSIEIINTSMAAVNTYTLLDIADDIVEINPDLVLFYAGHNEYLGVLGIGSSLASKGGRFTTLTYLWLKQFKLFQLLESVYFNLFIKDKMLKLNAQDVNSKRTLMSQAANGQNIAFESNLYHLGIEQYKRNLMSIANIYRTHNIPILVGNLVSIESGFIPFSINQIYDDIKSNDWCDSESESVTEADCTLFNEFERAQNLLKVGNVHDSRKHFNIAKDLDSLRFRAPTAFNAKINEITKLSGVYLVDVEKEFLKDSIFGVIDSNHMLEHVHPTLRGYFVLSEAYINKIIELNILGKPSAEFSTEKSWVEIPVSELDKVYAEAKISSLTNDFPFYKPNGNAFELDNTSFIYPFFLKKINGTDWLTLQNEMLQEYQRLGNDFEAARIAGIIVDALPLSNDSGAEHANFVAGQLYMKIQDYSLSQYYQKRALSLNTTKTGHILNLAQSAFLNEDFEFSLSLLQKAKQLDPTIRDLQFFIDRVTFAIEAKG